MPKKKPSKKGAKIIDGIATNEMSREQLMGHVKRMQMELDREREERNFFMLEREKLFSLWNMSIEQLTREKESNRLQELEICEREKEKEAEMDVYKQKLRYLMTEQSRKLGEVRLHNLETMKNVQDDMWTIQSVVRTTMSAKKKELMKAQVSLYEMMKNLRLQNAESISELRKEFSSEIRRLETEYDRKMYEQNELRVSEQNEELERLNIAKSEHIEELIKLHEKQLSEIKGHFDEITVNNFSVITALQQDLEEKKSAEEKLNAKLCKAREEHKLLEAELAKVQQEKMTLLADDRKSADHIRKELSKVRRRLESNERRTQIIQAENEALLHQLVFARKERDALKHTFAKAIVDMQRKSSMKRLILEMKLRSASKKQGGRPTLEFENLEVSNASKTNSVNENDTADEDSAANQEKNANLNDSEVHEADAPIDE